MDGVKTFILALLLLSCDNHETYYVDHRLEKYVNDFYIKKPFEKKNLIVKISDIGSFNGLFSNKNGQRTVEISIHAYENYSDDYIEAIVFHELGHAILNRHHYDQSESLMNTSPCLVCYSRNKEYYLNELFNPKK